MKSMYDESYQCVNRIAVKTALLHQSGLTQKKICSILKISETYLSRLINGFLPIPKNGRLLMRLADILRIDSEKLIQKKEDL